MARMRGTWIIDIEAKSHIEAGLQIQRDPKSIADVFEVDGIDLSSLDVTNGEMHCTLKDCGHDACPLHCIAPIAKVRCAGPKVSLWGKGVYRCILAA